MVTISMSFLAKHYEQYALCNVSLTVVDMQYLEFPEHHGSIQTDTTELFHFDLVSLHHTQLAAGQTRHS